MPLDNNFQYRPLNSSKNNNLSKPKLKKSWKEILVRVGLILAAFAAVGIIALTILVLVVSAGLPDVHDTKNLLLAQSTTIYDREGKVLYVKHGDQNREYVSYDEISPNLINATVALEDHKYWEHSGFDPVGMVRSLVNNVSNSDAQQGGSTITQQFIKQALLTSERTYTRKLKELILAIQLNQAYDKKKILELYLNIIPYGGTAYGIEKASQLYLGKSAKDLDIAESAVLASIPNSPTYYSPWGEHLYSKLTKQFTPEEISSRHINSVDDLKDDEYLIGVIGQMVKLDDNHSIYIGGRSDQTLNDMVLYGYISPEEKEKAWAEAQTMKFQKRVEAMEYPHFVNYVLSQLEDKYGKNVVEQGGLKVYTTLDADLQDVAEKVVADGAASNAKVYNAKNAALISLDPTNGHILAMVGSKGFDAPDVDGQTNITTSYLQPGSTFKPIVYAQAFYHGYGPGSIVFDVPTNFGDGPPPKNYDGKFRGPMSVRRALGQSRNIPAVKAYFLAGEKKPIMERAQKMGIHFAQEDPDISWSLALGGLEVRPLDMASAYGVFASNGIYHEPVAITKVENSQGEVLEEHENDPGEEALDPQISYLITSILSDKDVDLGENLNVPGQFTAAKTGTSDIKVKGRYYPHDLWTVGYSSNMVTAVWAGNNRIDYGLLYDKADGINVAAPIWNKYMRKALKKYPSSAFVVPQGIVKKTISKLTGKLADALTPDDEKTTEVFASFAVPTEENTGDQEVMIDVRNNKLANQYCPPNFVVKRVYTDLHDIASYPNWDKGVQDWIKNNMDKLTANSTPASQDPNSTTPSDLVIQTASTRIIGSPPTEESNLCTLENMNQKPVVEILQPLPFTEVQSASTLEVTIRINAFYLVAKVEYLVDGNIVNTALDTPYTGIIHLPRDVKDRTDHVITVRVTDKGGLVTEKNITVVSRLKGGNTGNNPTTPTTPDTNDTPTIPVADPGNVPNDTVPDVTPPDNSPAVPNNGLPPSGQPSG